MSSKSLIFSDCMSSALSCTPPRRSPPGWTMIIFDPISLISAWMLRFDPWPMASIVMTDATPMMMPSIVRNPRSLLLLSALTAIRNRLVKFIVYSSCLGSCARASAARKIFPLRMSLVMRPSRSVMLRLLYWAISGLCVTKMIVRPAAWSS